MDIDANINNYKSCDSENGNNINKNGNYYNKILLDSIETLFTIMNNH